MKDRTELRKGDIKKAAALVLACVLASWLLHIKWINAAREERELMQSRVSEAQAQLLAGTQAEEELEQIGQRVDMLEGSIRDIEKTFPEIDEVLRGYGRELIEIAGEAELNVISLENSEPEHAGGNLYRAHFSISLIGELRRTLGFIESIESGGINGIERLRLSAAEDGLIRADISLRAYGVRTGG